MSVCPSVSMCQHAWQWRDFFEISYWDIYEKSVQKLENWLKSDKNVGQFT